MICPEQRGKSESGKFEIPELYNWGRTSDPPGQGDQESGDKFPSEHYPLEKFGYIQADGAEMHWTVWKGWTDHPA